VIQARLFWYTCPQICCTVLAQLVCPMNTRPMQPLLPRPHLPGNGTFDSGVEKILKDASFQRGYRDLVSNAISEGTVLVGPREIARRASEALETRDYPLLDVVNGFVLSLELRTISTKERWADVQQDFIRSLEPGVDQDRAVGRSSQRPNSFRVPPSKATLSDLRLMNQMIDKLSAEQGTMQEFVKDLLVRAQVRTQRVKDYFDPEGGRAYVDIHDDNSLDRSVLSLEQDAAVAGQHLLVDSGALSVDDIRVFGMYAASRLAVALEYSRRIEAGQYRLPSQSPSAAG
jgi:hypothetical protein